MIRTYCTYSGESVCDSGCGLPSEGAVGCCHPPCEEMKVSPSSSVAIGTLYRFSAGCIAQYDCTCQTGSIR